MSTLTIFLEPIWRSAWKYIVGFASFPIAVRGSGLILEDVRKRWQSASAARRVISTQLDPLLKAADEVPERVRSEVPDFRNACGSLKFSPHTRVGIRESAEFDRTCEDPVLSARKIRSLFPRLQALQQVAREVESSG
jgi:hypothetical protein